jgi:hypothetical protein
MTAVNISRPALGNPALTGSGRPPGAGRPSRNPPEASAGWDRFWIANVIYLCFFLSAVLGAATKIIAYRKGFPRW